MSLVRGDRLGPYEIESTLGAGGMGEVYRARDTRLDRWVAIKVLPSHLAADQTAIARFRREARAVAALSHPNILALYDVGSANGLTYAVTELLEGETLRDRLQSGPLDARLAVNLGVQLVRGLAAAHDKGIVHRDLKPENLFITHAGQLKILDFGLAQHEAVSTRETMAATMDTSPGTVLGTVGYMSPEQVRGLETDHRTDLFAVGAVLYEMFSGRRAFRADTAADTLASIVRDHPPELNTLNSALPPALARIVARCLEKHPASRFQSAQDLAFALDALSQHGSSERVGPIAPLADEVKSLVVMPFEDLSPERDNAYFADGLTDEIISDLSRIGGLRVISRSSSMQLRNRDRDLATIARDLKVQYVLDGSVRKAGPRLRITAQLVDARTNTQLWSEKYNGTIDDIFEIQEQAARAIASELKGKLSKEESRELAQRPITDPRAYEYYLRARAQMMQFTPKAMERALADLEKGLALIGENPALLAAKGDCLWQLFNIGVITDPAHIDNVSSIAARIEQLEPGSHHASRLRGLVASHSHDHQLAARELKRSLAREPNDPFTGLMYFFTCAYAGHPSAASDIVVRIAAIDPLQIISSMLPAFMDFMEGRFARAVEAFSRAYSREPENLGAVVMYTQSLAAVGRVADAIEILDRHVKEAAPSGWTSLALILKYGLQEDADAITSALTPEMRSWCERDPQYALQIADAYALAGVADEAFRWIEQVLALGACPYPFVAKHDPFLARIRTDPRWPPMIERMRLASEKFEV